MILKFITLFLPWPLRRKALNSWFGYQINEKARIGLSWIFPKRLIMSSGSIIGHFSVAIHLDLIQMDERSSIGRNNWITGFPTGTSSLHFKHQLDRSASLIIGESANITKNHHFDCTNVIEIGRFSTVAGYNSQFLTHSVNLFHNRQDSMPILIGEYAFIGTNVVILGGSTLPSYSILGAKSLLNKKYMEEWVLYAGVPAIPKSRINHDAKYFNRSDGYIY